MNMVCLSTYMNKYLKSREDSIEKIAMHKIKRFGDFYFLSQTQTEPKLKLKLPNSLSLSLVHVYDRLNEVVLIANISLSRILKSKVKFYFGSYFCIFCVKFKIKR